MTLTSKSTSAYALITDLFAIIDGADWAQFSRVLAPDCVCERPNATPLAGLAAIEHFYRHVRPVESGRHDIYAIVSDLGVAACWGKFSGRGKTGAEIDARFAETFLVKDGKIAVRTTYLHGASAQVPPGLRPPSHDARGQKPAGPLPGRQRVKCVLDE